MGKAKTFGQLRRFPVRQRRFQSKSGPSPKVPRASIERRERKKIKAKDVGDIETVVRVRVMGREQQHNKQSGLLSVKIQREGRTKNARGDRVSSAASNRSDEPAQWPNWGGSAHKTRLHIRITWLTEYTEHCPLALTEIGINSEA